MQRYNVGHAAIELVSGNLVEQNVDAIVNAANEALAEGGGVCGAIFQAAGNRELARACRPLAPCPTGEARITPGFALPARYIIHAVGPIYNPHSPAESAWLLARTYGSSLALAAENNLASLAFPSISTGIFGYPVEEAAIVAINTVRDVLEAPLRVTLVRFVLWGQQNYDAYVRAAQLLGLQPEQELVTAEAGDQVAAGVVPSPAAVTEPLPPPDPVSAGTVPPDALTQLTMAAKGLLVPGERDDPLVPFHWPGPEPLTPETLLAHFDLPPDTPVATRTLAAFLGPLAAEQAWFNEAQRDTAARFAALQDQIAALLSNVVVYRLGRTRITVVIVGVDAAGQPVGLQTTLIES